MQGGPLDPANSRVVRSVNPRLDPTRYAVLPKVLPNACAIIELIRKREFPGTANSIVKEKFSKLEFWEASFLLRALLGAEAGIPRLAPARKVSAAVNMLLPLAQVNVITEIIPAVANVLLPGYQQRLAAAINQPEPSFTSALNLGNKLKVAWSSWNADLPDRKLKFLVRSLVTLIERAYRASGTQNRAFEIGSFREFFSSLGIGARPTNFKAQELIHSVLVEKFAPALKTCDALFRADLSSITSAGALQTARSLSLTARAFCAFELLPGVQQELSPDTATRLHRVLSLLMIVDSQSLSERIAARASEALYRKGVSLLAALAAEPSESLQLRCSFWIRMLGSAAPYLPAQKPVETGLDRKQVEQKLVGLLALPQAAIRAAAIDGLAELALIRAIEARLTTTGGARDYQRFLLMPRSAEVSSGDPRPALDNLEKIVAAKGPDVGWASTLISVLKPFAAPAPVPAPVPTKTIITEPAETAVAGPEISATPLATVAVTKIAQPNPPKDLPAEPTVPPEPLIEQDEEVEIPAFSKDQLLLWSCPEGSQRYYREIGYKFAIAAQALQQKRPRDEIAELIEDFIRAELQYPVRRQRLNLGAPQLTDSLQSLSVLLNRKNDRTLNRMVADLIAGIFVDPPSGEFSSPAGQFSRSLLVKRMIYLLSISEDHSDLAWFRHVITLCAIDLKELVATLDGRTRRTFNSVMSAPLPNSSHPET